MHPYTANKIQTCILLAKKYDQQIHIPYEIPGWVYEYFEENKPTKFKGKKYKKHVDRIIQYKLSHSSDHN
jgi:pyruvoyl-dependent arginine decarboxylase (PvlArgDC)